MASRKRISTLSFATRGLGKLTGKNHATIHNGQYGLLMEMAPGRTGKDIGSDRSAETKSKFNSLSVVGNLAKELNDLRWFDIATGQGDRHHANYLIDFGNDGKTPKVTAIDNDVSFMPYLVGVGKYNVAHHPIQFHRTNRRKNPMKELLETLNEWLSWFENPSETLPSALIEENAVIGLNARGFNSNRFICRFKTEKMDFDVELLMNDKSGEEDAAAMVKLALVALNTPFEEKVEVIVSDRLANYNGGTLKDFLNLIDRINYSKSKSEEIILP